MTLKILAEFTSPRAGVRPPSLQTEWCLQVLQFDYKRIPNVHYCGRNLCSSLLTRVGPLAQLFRHAPLGEHREIAVGETSRTILYSIHRVTPRSFQRPLTTTRCAALGLLHVYRKLPPSDSGPTRRDSDGNQRPQTLILSRNQYGGVASRLSHHGDAILLSLMFAKFGKYRDFVWEITDGEWSVWFNWTVSWDGRLICFCLFTGSMIQWYSWRKFSPRMQSSLMSAS